MQITAGSQNVQIPVYARTTSGAALTGKVAADFTLSYRRDGANVAIALSNLTALTDAHTDGGIYEVGNGEYRLDVPDVAFAAGASNVTIGGTVDGGVVLGYPISLDSSGTTGTGARAITFTVTTGGTAIQGVTVRLYRTGSVDRVGQTGSGGTVTLNADVDATWSYTVTHPLYDGATGTVVVDGNKSVPVSLTAKSWPASTEPNSVTVRWRVKKTNRTWAGAGEATVYIQILEGPGTDGVIWHGDNNDFDSKATDASGYVEFTNVPVPCTLGVRTGTGRQLKTVSIPEGADAEDVYDAGELISLDA